ncbi:MAG: aminopeptidase [Agathobacter sp.]|nr:aminopeptidase [Agathobacter sp.]
MKYQELIRENQENLKERLELVMERVLQIEENPEVESPFKEYFVSVAKYIDLQYQVIKKANDGKIASMTAEQGKELNEALFADVKKENYVTSFANPSYAVNNLGEDYGQLLCAVYDWIRSKQKFAFEGNFLYTCIGAELFVELYTFFEEENKADLSKKLVKDNIYSFVHDYMEDIGGDSVRRMVNPDYDYFYSILMEADLDDPAYLYRYGLHVSDNERIISKYLKTFSEEELQAMADTYTEGYRIGFVNGGKDLSKKTTVEVRYPIGFERMVRLAVENFKKMNLRATLVPSSTSVNKQYEYDHKDDQGLWYDKALAERKLEVIRDTFEQNKEIAVGYAGPAVIEVFGEEPFSPETKKEKVELNEKQQQISVYEMSEQHQLIYKYIKGEERSFTIIAYPVPAIGEKFEEIFAETVKLNTLDYVLYQNMQQKLIDVLDTADRVHIVGANGNKTDLYVKIFPLANPEKETAFENCVADVNIPVGEVFTSPVLKGTEGKLHVSQVFLRELNYKNLEIDFVDGMISSYTCTNFKTEEENKKYIKDNIMHHHDTLPMGEFAIGTNTTAYRMARVYDIAAKLPILIAEKTGPHFAVGDTCYSFDEDNVTYNPDGKVIVAKENDVSALRKTDMSKAYYSCHTDITIPYDELGRITAISKDGTEIDIIVDGKFVVPGTEELNKPLLDM